VLLGNGDGTFQAQHSFYAGDTWHGYGYDPLSLSDVNSDGALDVIATRSNDNTAVFLGNGDGTFQTLQWDYTIEGSTSNTLVDMNSDGLLDLAISSRNGNISVLLGNGDGSFQAEQRIAVGGSPRFLTFGDVNGDGMVDAVTNTNGIFVLLGNRD
jgi:hypothetical protein